MGVIGGNGTGKTSLLRLIAGEAEPDGGVIKLGDTVKAGYVSQARDGLDPRKTVYQEISQGAETMRMGDRDVNVRAYVSTFNLKGPTQEKTIDMLSGGERGRVHRAKTWLGLGLGSANPNPSPNPNQARAPRQDAARGVQPAAARRAVERPGQGQGHG